MHSNWLRRPPPKAYLKRLARCEREEMLYLQRHYDKAHAILYYLEKRMVDNCSSI